MKKSILIMAVALSAATVSAQESFKPEVGKVSIEVGFNPFSDYVITLPNQSLKAYYSLSDQLSIRLGLGFDRDGTSYNSGNEGDKERTTSNTTFSIAPGATYSLRETGRLIPYVGAEIVFATTSNETAQGDYTVTNAPAGNPSTRFGLNVLTGINYYVAKNLYIGTEIALGYVSTSLKQSETSSGGTTTKDKAESSSSNFGISATPSLRLGWTF
ncbi:hypothetical protein AGMMS4957_14060 [Bacteroidia bacterium]|nr:hypothetical protein AGMMS4957_14060 [Bacteroidia bacterium]